MILIEFFDTNDIENIAGSLLTTPEKVFFIGDNAKTLFAAKNDYAQVLSNRGINTVFEPRTVNRNNLVGIIDTLSEIITSSDDQCIIDITGGDELFLVAAGTMLERYPDKVSLHKFNVRSGMLYDCDTTGNTLKAGPASITVRENALIYGGKVTDSHDMHYDFNSIANDIYDLWSVFCDNVSYWNSQCITLSGINLYFPQTDPLGVDICKETTKETLIAHNVKYVCFHALFKALEQKGLIKGFVNEKSFLQFTYKNRVVKDCLTKAGLLLELYIALTVMSLENKKGDKIFADVISGVVLDWDGVDNLNAPDVENEIDVLAMHGLVPVFISCKNGAVDINELYKLKTVAERFGGKYAKKVLVCTELDPESVKGKYIALRANEMDIILLDRLEKLTREKIKRALSF